MKRKILFLTILLTINATYIYCQSTSDSIQVTKKMGTVFIQNGKALMPKQLLKITEVNPEAYKEMKIAKSNSNTANIFGMAGGFLVGWQLGTALAGGEPNWASAGIGAGLIGISIPFSVAYVKHAKNAVSIYNNGLKQSNSSNLNLNFGLTGNGLALKMTF
jgi:hypothetical protein